MLRSFNAVMAHVQGTHSEISLNHWGKLSSIGKNDPPKIPAKAIMTDPVTVKLWWEWIQGTSSITSPVIASR
ncbi:hypothetical protein D1872_342350 [compost metagenome]